MARSNTWLLVLAVALTAFVAGRWSNSTTTVKADSGASPQIQIRPVGADSSLTVYYPNLNKLFVYQNPMVGLPTWSCSYSIQLSTPGGKIVRDQCANPGQQF